MQSGLCPMGRIRTLLFLFYLKKDEGSPGGSAGLGSPSAQGMILETQDQIPCRASCMEPASPSAWVSAILSLSVSLMNK